MAHFAKVENNIVTQVIVVEQDVLDTGLFGDPSLWIQTSYNTHGGVHTLGGTPLRMNFAGVGYRYDIYRDAFIPPQPYLSWVLNNDTCLWEAPIPYPADGNSYLWDEATLSWVEVPAPTEPTATSDSTITISTAAETATFDTASDTITLG
jgi:hypothetical protein